jgi:hypothetical protein
MCKWKRKSAPDFLKDLRKEISLEVLYILNEIGQHGTRGPPEMQLTTKRPKHTSICNFDNGYQKTDIPFSPLLTAFQILQNSNLFKVLSRVFSKVKLLTGK